MQHPPRRRSIPKALAAAAITGVTAVTLVLPGAVAYADPVPPPPAPAPAPAPVDPNAPPPPPADPNAPPPPAADPNAQAPDPNVPPPPPPPEPGRVDNAAGGFSYVVPAGWKVSDNTQLSYGQALLTKIPEGGADAPSDTSVLLGRLDLKLFAGAETDNSKAATRLASDMGEFFMPFAGTRQNQQAGPLDAAGLPGAFSSYEVKFTDTTKPNGESPGRPRRRGHSDAVDPAVHATTASAAAGTGPERSATGSQRTRTAARRRRPGARHGRSSGNDAARLIVGRANRLTNVHLSPA
jgi:hypothetical protein